MGGTAGSLISLVLMIALFWFLLIRPQQMQAKKRAEMLTALKAGDKIITIGGLCGTVKAITDTKVFVELSDGVTVEMLRNAISQLDQETDDEDEDIDEDEDFYDDEEFDDDDIYYDEDDVDDVKKSDRE